MTEGLTGRLPARSYSRLTFVAVALLLGVAAVILILDRKQLEALLQTSRWQYLWGALACTVVSYAGGATTLVVMMRVFNVRLRRQHLWNMGAVSMAMGNLLGPPTDTSLRLLFLGRHGVKNSETVAASLLMQYFKNLFYYSLIPVSLIWVAVSHPLPAFGAATILLVVAALIALLAVATTIAFSPRARSHVLRLIARVWRFATHRDIQGHLEQFNDTLKLGTTSLMRRKRQLLPLLATIALDTLDVIAALWFCFAALGITVPAGVLLAGFNFGVTLAIFAFIPGRMGVQEATMAGVFALFGVPFSQAVIVAMLFRVVYYVVPFIATLPLYWALAREKVRYGETTEAAAVQEAALPDSAAPGQQ
jgi:uncharacterized protein (TIRG00374 family)